VESLYLFANMKLLIVESPSKAKTIEKYLDGKYTVRASIGHVRDLPKTNRDAIDIPGGFVPRYEISLGKHRVISELQHWHEKLTRLSYHPIPTVKVRPSPGIWKNY
jgi:DNA topoisomerase IA